MNPHAALIIISLGVALLGVMLMARSKHKRHSLLHDRRTHDRRHTPS